MSVWNVWPGFLGFFAKAGDRAPLANGQALVWCFFAIGAAWSGAPGVAEARTETIRWTHPGLASGFRIFERREGEGYQNPSYDGLPQQSGGVYQVDLVIDDNVTVHFVATAYNQTEESVISNEITSVPPFCGDGNLDPGETCDDGNTAGGDGCRADCTLEFCGDGSLDPGEQCDDGNINDNDGCDANCQNEAGPVPEPRSAAALAFAVLLALALISRSRDARVKLAAAVGGGANLVAGGPRQWTTLQSNGEVLLSQKQPSVVSGNKRSGYSVRL